MHDYMSGHRLFREIVSIKRAQWTMIWLALASVTIAVTLACYGAVVVNEQMNTISQSVGAQIHSHTQLQHRIVNELMAGRDADFYYPLVVRSSNVMIHVNTFARHTANASDVEYFSECPASASYKDYLTQLYKLNNPPVISNVFLFAGGHGLGKTYASFQLGKALSKFADTIVISVPMNTFGNINDAGALIERLENALGGKCFIVWTFDELDSYLLRDDMRDKTITQFAEYTGFVKSANRVLVFTMNNAEVLLHNYWADRTRIETNLTHYEHANDLAKALEFTQMDQRMFLQEGQLSRLYSFVGNKLFVYRPFTADVARKFADQYLKRAGIAHTDMNGLFNENVQYSIRTVKIILDDTINKFN
ncbi:hypothetical protein AGNV_048 [Anticarsia gemmatalis multiple nucleopolyhedrovirus]|uniref:Uncharacterized protein n=1 Tax=Anticarsia gemmatalis multiple nucleopolyhedrovirus TaxID=268591 RepID=A0A0S3IWH9_9ABAC|nr:hypothetical protein AGNV_048 [Anticarsia gemmatalis multiple nucleopolyhedrovirus]YP_803506.1 hypothetical protein AGNV_048 [Anticarsia gemmatalis nucleopolyhedrovirus]ABI13895.1 hypothetical protein AGNV_048 [Anticarsia gemmatalis multiple nucleopolyhedrovirus]ALR69855.1 hypothetical protein AGNV_048 [Anticarsia gemmatalis multiple nucleopolyhedrovirus]ALR70013.1 hypothetical protein AGNV_048 [Anticarsia gemmatalis multiple nucleopolyhedrovirus]ALR70170.1 hypothetical protein AGNV_048 [An